MFIGDRRRFLGAAGILLATACAPQLMPTPEKPRQGDPAIAATKLAGAVAKPTEIPKPDIIYYENLSELELLKLSAETKQKHHFRTESGIVLPTEPYLLIPIAKASLPKVAIAQGWFPNKEEVEISQVDGHQGIDIAGPHGLELFAPVNGYYLCTVEENVRKSKDGKVLLLPGSTNPDEWIAYGGGTVIEYIEEKGRENGQILHNAEVDDAMPFAIPSPRPGGGWIAQSLGLPFEEFKAKAKYYKAGEYIGKMGYTGLGIGTYGKYRGENRPPKVVDGDFRTWDKIKAHAHWGAHKRPGKHPRDPFAKYSITKYYDLRAKLEKEALIRSDSEGFPLFAA